MKITEHLQFLFLMIPTLLLLAAMALTLAFPAKDPGEPVPGNTFALEYVSGEEPAAQDYEDEPRRTAAVK